MSDNFHEAAPARALLSINDTVHALNISRTKLYELIASKELGSVTIGRRRFVPRRGLEDFLAALSREAK